jgi:nitrate reductase gamma subunit
MPPMPRFWIGTFNLTIAGLSAWVAYTFQVHGGPVTCGSHWENDLSLLSALAMALSGGMAFVASLVGSVTQRLLWRRAQQMLAWVCSSVALWLMIVLLKHGLATGSWALTCGNSIPTLAIPILGYLCATKTRHYTR